MQGKNSSTYSNSVESDSEDNVNPDAAYKLIEESLSDIAKLENIAENTRTQEEWLQLADSYESVGMHYFMLQNYLLAIEYFQKSKQLFHHIDDNMTKWNLAFNVISYLGFAYLREEDDDAENYLEQAFDILINKLPFPQDSTSWENRKTLYAWFESLFYFKNNLHLPSSIIDESDEKNLERMNKPHGNY
jgi:tetratricopeptide (TPR) repeat protein